MGAWPQTLPCGISAALGKTIDAMAVPSYHFAFALKVAALVLCVSMQGVAVAKNVALLIGVGQLKDPALKDSELGGPPIDVESVRQTLTAQWGFAPADVHVLLNAQATHDGILAEIADMEKRSAAGDTLLIYFSGHGTSANADNNSFALPYATGAWVPYDLDEDSLETAQRTLIIGHRDLLPRLKRLDESGRFVVVVSDSCYSGQVVRAFGFKSHGMRTRFLPLRVRDLGIAPNAPPPAPAVTVRPPPEPYPYQHVVLLSGASDSETGLDISTADMMAQFPTYDGQYHGAFTDAFLRLLKGQIVAGTFNYAQGREAMYNFLEQRNIQQHPQLLPGIADDSHDIDARTFLASNTSAAPGGGSAAPAAGPAAGPATGAPAAGVPATGTPAAPSHKVAELHVRFEGTAAALRTKIAAIPGVGIVDKAGDLVVRQSGATVDLLGPAGDPVTSTSADDPKLLARIAAQAWLARNLPVESTDTLGLRAGTEPASRGNTYVQCEDFVFEVKLQKPAFVMLLDLDSDGKLKVLYPASALERRMLPNGVAIAVPGPDPKDHILVTPPFGADLVTVMAFERQPAFLADLTGAQAFSADSKQADSLSQGLANTPGAISVHQVSVNTYPASGKVSCR